MKRNAILGLGMLLLAVTAYADDEILLLKAIGKEPPNNAEGLPRPKPGMSRENVSKVFGPPEHASKPVGKPPIYRWEYAKYIVYFENDRVINTVIKKPNKR